jgi:peptidoglycan/xylan/chitin deacetylase (PgdA/CDA1 family)
VAVGQRQVITSVPAAGHAVALTFDMGGRLDPGLDILNFLIANHVCTTIFPTGAMSNTATGQQVLAVIRAHPELFELGNHTMHHCNLVTGGLGSPTTAPCVTNGPPSAAFISAELTDAAVILEAGSGQDPIPYWRPPYGSTNELVLATAAGLGYTKTIMWSVDTIDWKPISDGGPTAEAIASKVVTTATDGSIVLMHLGGYETLDALQIMVPALRERGLLLTSVSDLLN